MRHSIRPPLTILVLSMVVLACVLPSFALEDPAVISTAAAQTVIAGFTQAAVISGTPSETPTAIASLTPETPTVTFTLPPTDTPTLTATVTPFFTATPMVTLISVSVPTNCRVGPGKVYRMVGALLVGEVAQVYGRDPTGQYWYIRNPDSGNEFCWLWGEYATLTGNTSVLPILTPPPTPIPSPTSTPAPGFEASFTGLDSCVGWWPEFKLRNTGPIPFKSMAITVRDTVTDVVLTSYTDTFTDSNGCLSIATLDTLGVGKSFVISGPEFGYDPDGHKLRAAITLCSKVNQNGTCVTTNLAFKP